MNNSAMNNTASSVSAPVNNKMSRLGNAIKNAGSARETLDIAWGTIGIITILGFIYMVAASIGINTFSKCEKFKGKQLQENLNKVLVATLGMALAIPFTLSMTKMFSNEMPVFLLTYAIMGVIGTSIALNWNVNCEDTEKNNTTAIGVSLASFIAMLMFGVYLIVPKSKMGLE